MSKFKFVQWYGIVVCLLMAAFCNHTYFLFQSLLNVIHYSIFLRHKRNFHKYKFIYLFHENSF